MGKTYKELKKKIGQLRFENSFLTLKVEKVLLENGRLKRELQISNARIVELAQEIELLKNGLAFLNEVKEALNDEDIYSQIQGLQKLATISRKAVVFGQQSKKEKVGEPLANEVKEALEAFSSFLMGFISEATYAGFLATEVSVYEAIPELIPDGMFYDKESDSLIKKDKR